MKTKRTVMTMLVACVWLSVTHDALGFYNPSTGRWLSRDPIGERGFNTTAGNAVRNKGSAKKKELLLYAFMANHPIKNVDVLGLSCEDPCKWAREQNEDDATGATVCCGGKKYGCVVYSGGNTVATDPIARQIIDPCTQAHEDSHVSDPNLKCPKQCIWKRPTFAEYENTATKRNGECEAYTAHVSCLQNGRERCNGDATCEAQVDAEISNAQKAADSYCN